MIAWWGSLKIWLSQLLGAACIAFSTPRVILERKVGSSVECRRMRGVVEKRFFRLILRLNVFI